MTIIQYQHVSAWAAAQGIDPKRALAVDLVPEDYDHHRVTEELHRYSELMVCRLFELVPFEIPGYSVLYYKSSIEIPEFTGTAVVCPVRVRRQGCPIVFGDLMVEWGPTRQAGKVWKEVPSVDPALLHLTMTPEEVLEWAIREQIDPSQAVVVDWVPMEHNAMYVNCRWLAFGLGDDILQVARKPSRVKGYSSMLYRVLSGFRDHPGPCRIYPMRLPPEGCPLIYPKLGMSSTVEDKCQDADKFVITSEEVYKWAVREGVDPKRAVVLDEVPPLAPRYLAACPLSLFPRFDGYRFIAQAQSEVRDCVRLLWQVDNDLPDDDEGPPRIYPVGMLDGCACVYAKLSIQPLVKEESAEVVIACTPELASTGLTDYFNRKDCLEKSGVPAAELPSDKSVEGCVENLPPTETELCTLNVLNCPVVEAFCVNLENPEQECSQCGVQLWMGRFHCADQLPLEQETVEGVVSGTRALVYHEIESTPGVSAVTVKAPLNTGFLTITCQAFLNHEPTYKAPQIPGL
ncbi:hypothetical protein XELAEV_18003855mg [Xenopus laevis]|nr:hypothetical protein XELAEV_18003855mg [Xenopus laevis]